MKRESAIIENEKQNLERKQQLIPARRRRNTRGDFRQVSSEGDVGTGPKTESERKMDNGPKNGPKPEVDQWTQTDTSADQNFNVQMERLANLTFQAKFLGGAKAHNMNGLIINMGKSIIDSSGYFAGFAVDQFDNHLLVANFNLLVKMENGTFSGLLEIKDEQNSIKLLKAHSPVMLSDNGPEQYVAKQMIGKSFRLDGNVKTWMRGRNKFGRQCDFQVQLKRVILKIELDDLMVFSLCIVGAI